MALTWTPFFLSLFIKASGFEPHAPTGFVRYRTDVSAAGHTMSGASWGWQNEMLKMNTKFSQDFTWAKMRHKKVGSMNVGYKSIVCAVTTPILMGQAGLDSLAYAGAQDDYCAHAMACNVGYPLNSKGKKPIRYEMSKHELYNEKSSIRNHWIQESLKFFASHSK